MVFDALFCGRKHAIGFFQSTTQSCLTAEVGYVLVSFALEVADLDTVVQ